jgi:hypothetical protein
MRPADYDFAMPAAISSLLVQFFDHTKGIPGTNGVDMDADKIDLFKLQKTLANEVGRLQVAVQKMNVVPLLAGNSHQ